METSRDVMEVVLGKRPEHLAYPVGDPTTAGPRIPHRRRARPRDRGDAPALACGSTSTRPSHRAAAHSVNGEFQEQRYMPVLMSGAATALWNGFRRR